jgi:hypothetical protein
MVSEADDTVTFTLGEDEVTVRTRGDRLLCPAGTCRVHRGSVDDLKKHLVYHDGYTTKLTSTCETCGEEFSYYKRPSEDSDRRGTYCSDECQNRDQEKPRVTYTCDRCGEEFEGRADRDRRYCSARCAQFHSIND